MHMWYTGWPCLWERAAQLKALPGAAGSAGAVQVSSQVASGGGWAIRELQWVCRVSAETEVKLKVSRAGDDGFFYILIVPVATSPRTCLSSQHRNFGNTSRWGTM